MTTNRFGSAAYDAALAAEVRAEIARRKDISVASIAASLGVRRATVSARVNGHVPFTYSQLLEVAEILGVPAEALGRRARAAAGLTDTSGARDDAFLAVAAGVPSPSPRTSAAS